MNASTAQGESVTTPRLRLRPGRARHGSTTALRRNLVAYAFLSPFFALFITFTAVPFFWALWLALQQGLLTGPKTFVGLSNFMQLPRDTITRTVLFNTVKYVAIIVPVAVSSSLGLAFLITNRVVRGRDFFRALVYFPILAAPAAAAQIWSYILAPRFGVFSYVLSALGLGDVLFLSNPQLALLSIALIEWWRGIGFHVILFIASLMGIPKELKEAATIDGATSWQVATRVTIPLMRPVILFSVVMGTIWAFQLFDTVFVLTQGGPMHSTATMVWYIYNHAFRYSQLGLAAAMGVVLLLIIAPISYVQMAVLGKEVEYA
ncbi:MAG: sugar ABC transporter permease [Anaerolineae bacterium]|nr:sugar ABC transporter permease [Anaerolineae bacterium]